MLFGKMRQSVAAQVHNSVKFHTVDIVGQRPKKSDIDQTWPLVPVESNNTWQVLVAIATLLH